MWTKDVFFWHVSNPVPEPEVAKQIALAALLMA